MAVLHPRGTEPLPPYENRPTYPWEEKTTKVPQIPECFNPVHSKLTMVDRQIKMSDIKRARLDRHNKKRKAKRDKIKEIKEKFRQNEIARMRAGFAIDPEVSKRELEALLRLYK